MYEKENRNLQLNYSQPDIFVDRHQEENYTSIVSK